MNKENKRRLFEKFIFRNVQNIERHTQDSPVFPEVWMEFFQKGTDVDIDLILTPNKHHSAGILLKELRKNLRNSKRAGDKKNPWRLASTGEIVAARLTFSEVVNYVLPMTSWWNDYLWKEEDNKAHTQKKWYYSLKAVIQWYHENKDKEDQENDFDKKMSEFYDQAEVPSKPYRKYDITPLWSFSLNRPAEISLYKSCSTIKADASRRLFNIDGSKITWAIIDSGIDAAHKRFLKQGEERSKDQIRGLQPTKDQLKNSRVKATYDFTKFRDIMGLLTEENHSLKDSGKKISISVKQIKLVKEELPAFGLKSSEIPGIENINLTLSEMERGLRSGRDLDWSAIAPMLRVPHTVEGYYLPKHPHGTHVAGILGAKRMKDDKEGDKFPEGVCPNINLYDLRVFDEKGRGDEFSILAALQFIRYLNRQKDQIQIHGVNLSLSIKHDVKNYACGRTPICEECNRLVGQGAVVVAAAGNEGRITSISAGNQENDTYNTLSITDPGNADCVITVGSTHRNKPHTYGVSYFSSRGPTGDGRIKPDLVAPGEKIVSIYLDDKEERLDGTSMAAPHVSGAAALLLAKHRELIGQPQRVKEILCNTATDLGREKYFQGHGLVDILRAIQSI